MACLREESGTVKKENDGVNGVVSGAVNGGLNVGKDVGSDVGSDVGNLTQKKIIQRYNANLLVELIS